MEAPFETETEIISIPSTTSPRIKQDIEEIEEFKQSALLSPSTHPHSFHTPNNKKSSNMVRKKQQHMISDLNKRENTPSKASPSISYSDILRFLDKKGDLKQAENLKQLAKEMKTSITKSQTMDKLIKVEEDNQRLKKELEALERELKDLSSAEQQQQQQQHQQQHHQQQQVEVSLHENVSMQHQATQTIVMIDSSIQTEEDFYKTKSEEQEHIIELLQHQSRHENSDIKHKYSQLKTKYKQCKEEVKRLKKGFSMDEFKDHFMQLQQQNEQILQENEDLLKSIKLLQAHSQMVKSQLKVVEKEKKTLQKHAKQLERLLSFLDGVNGYVNEKVSSPREKQKKVKEVVEEIQIPPQKKTTEESLYPSHFSETLMKRFSLTHQPTIASSQPLRSPSISPPQTELALVSKHSPTTTTTTNKSNKDISVEVSQDGQVYIKGDHQHQTVLLEEFIQRHIM